MESIAKYLMEALPPGKTVRDIPSRREIIARGTQLHPEYTCNVCQDSGWVLLNRIVTRCTCKKQADLERRQIQYLRYCELPAATENRTFENFNAYTPRLKEALNAAKDVVNRKINLLVLASGVDRGKSHLAIAICRAWLKKGNSAKYAFVPDMLDELKDGFLHKGEESYYGRFQFYKLVSLLVLDDMGAEAKTAWGVEKLEQVINSRGEDGLTTVITTNCELSEFTERIRSRIRRWPNGVIIAIKPDQAPEYSDYGKVKSGV